MNSDSTICYTTTDGLPLIPSTRTSSGEAQLLSNRFVGSRWVMQFDRPVRALDGGMFFNSVSLNTISLPSSVVSIGDGAFFGCSSLRSIDLPHSLTHIGEAAFCGCSSLTEITLPEGIESIGRNAFDGCVALRRFAGGPASADGRCLIVDGHMVAFAPAGLSEYQLPPEMQTIDKDLFADADSLQVLIFTTPPRQIVGGALALGDQFHQFRGAGASADGRCLIIGSRVVAFASAGLRSYSLPEGVTGIERFCIEGCSPLEELILPSSLCAIGDWALSGCRSLSHLYSKAPTPPVLGFGALSQCDKLCKISVPPGSAATYRTSDGWCDHAEIITE